MSTFAVSRVVPASLFTQLAASLLAASLVGCAPRSTVAPPVAMAGLSDTVRPGDPRVDARRLRPAQDTADWLVETRGERRVVGRFDDRLMRGRLGDQAAIVRVLAVTSGTATLVDSSWSDPRTLAPLAHRSRQPTRSLEVRWVGDAVQGAILPAGGAHLGRDSVLGLRTFDSSNWDLVIRSLDLAPGVTRVFPVYDVDARVRWYRARVRGDSLVGGRRAFVVEAELGTSWAWVLVDAATRRVYEQRMGNPQAPMRVVPATAEGTARRQLERAIAAAGGDRALTAARTLWWSGTATVLAGPRPVEIVGTWTVLPPDSAIVDTRPVGSDPSATRGLLLAAPSGWLSRGEAREPMPPALLASERDEFWFYHVLRLVPLRDTAIALTPASADSAGWTAVTATRAGRPTVTLQFDAAHRVRTAAATITGADGRAARQVLQLDGTIEAGGVRWFRTMAITHDGAPFFTLTIGEFAVDRVLDRRRLAP
ncbi:MAG: hypothetical protein MUF53_02925 [Gemmatimonadaceae bacterium]|nr:hypothetical protein [Gemmatimonadaceae bacterium]